MTFTARFASGAVGTLSASRSAPGRPNALGFELFGERAAAGFDLSRAGEFTYTDTALTGPTAGERRVLAGPQHPYLSGGLAMDFPGVGYGQNDLFVYQARAFLNQICGIDGLAPCPPLEHGRHNLQVLQAVVDSCDQGRRRGRRLRPITGHSSHSRTDYEGAMKLGVYTACLHDKPLPEALAVIAGLGLESAEINSGGFLPAVHLPIEQLRASATARDDYLGQFDAGRGHADRVELQRQSRSTRR